jgi:hypothetical protein
MPRSEQDSVSDSVVLITSADVKNSRFGTGFIFRHQEDWTYLITCAHVVQDVGGNEQVWFFRRKYA